MLWSVVDGTSLRAAADNVAKWDEKNVKAMASIVTTLDSRNTNHVYKCTTAKEMFDRLQSIHSDSSELNKMHTLSAFLNFKIKPEQSMQDAYYDIEKLTQSLGEMGVEINEITTITKTVSAMPDEKFKAFKAAWDSVPVETQTMAYLLSRLKKEDLQLAQATLSAAETESPSTQSKAYQGKSCAGSN